jgi:hypothetical protein
MEKVVYIGVNPYEAKLNTDVSTFYKYLLEGRLSQNLLQQILLIEEADLKSTRSDFKLDTSWDSRLYVTRDYVPMAIGFMALAHMLVKDFPNARYKVWGIDEIVDEKKGNQTGVQRVYSFLESTNLFPLLLKATNLIPTSSLEIEPLACVRSGQNVTKNIIMK